MSSFANSPNGGPVSTLSNTTSSSQRPACLSTSGQINAMSSDRTGGDAFTAVAGDANFDIFEWYPAYQSCQRYFLNHAQHDGSVQAVAALVNICLPYQWAGNPILSSSNHSPSTGSGPFGAGGQRPGPGAASRPTQPASATSGCVSLLPFIRRLVVTGFDRGGVLHGFFGDEWRKGVGPLQECERRNYLFAAKSVAWAEVKSQYDMNPHETVPFLSPLQNVPVAEIEGAEKTWSQWLAMGDWMLGERAPERMDAEERSGPGANVP